MKTSLPTLKMRHPQQKDAQEITNMIVLCDIDDHGVPDITLDDLLHMWSFLDLDSNAWVVCTQENRIVGYGFLDRRGESRMDTCIFVHPEYKNQGVGSMLLSTVENRAKEISNASSVQQSLMNHIPYKNAAARELVERHGFSFTRLYKRMMIALSEMPMEHSLPEGMSFLPFRPDQDEQTLYDLYHATFADSWGYAKKDFSDWIHEQKGDHFDPSYWYIVWDDQKPAAFLMGKMQEDGLYIDYLGVKRDYRKKGIGHSLLLHAFGSAYRVGQNVVHLSVDSDSLTNAQFLYERAGMKSSFQTALYRKDV